MYENYLINASAVADIISRLENFSDEPVEPKDIAKWIENNRWGKAYFEDIKALPNKDEITWLHYAHGGKFLNDLFRSFLKDVILMKPAKFNTV